MSADGGTNHRGDVSRSMNDPEPPVAVESTPPRFVWCGCAFPLLIPVVLLLLFIACVATLIFPA